MSETIGWLEALGSMSLVLVALGLSKWRGLGVEGSIVWAAVRAAVQLAAVGVVFDLIFGSSTAMVWAWLWVVGMLLLSTEVVRHRARDVPGLRSYALAALGIALVVSLGLLFGLGVFDFEPVTLVVIAGITLGNTLPATVLAVDTAQAEFVENPERVEGLLALGMDPDRVARLITPPAVRRALIPQIERTKVVGLVALPGAMTGMLLAGADAFSAVTVQLVIMYLVLGSVAMAVVVTSTVVALRAFTPDARLQPWVRVRS